MSEGWRGIVGSAAIGEWCKVRERRGDGMS